MRLIAVIDEGYDSYSYEQELFRQHAYRFEVFAGDRHDRKAKSAFAQNAEGILVRWTVIDENFLNTLPHLRAIVRYGTGYDNIDVQAVKRHGIRFANVQGYASHSVSDHALMLLFACARGLLPGQKTFFTGYTNPPFADILELREMTLGIIGLGRIGSALCRKAQSLFKRVLANDPYVPPQKFAQFQAETCSLSALLQQSDAISLHCNLTKETTHLIKAQELEQMLRRPVLVNTSRGPVLDEQALLPALAGNKIHSLGLDVFSDEPPGENMKAVLQHPRVVATAHYAWYSRAANLDMQKRAAENLLGLLQGKAVEDEL
jgi:D-3-phosphoglycerate dehydrogenase / 2-oxoglutarate reductase